MGMRNTSSTSQSMNSLRASGILSHELRKCFTNPWFTISLLIGSLLTIVSAVEAMNYVTNGPGPDGHYVSCIGSYANWMVVNCGQGPTPFIFFYVVPLLSVMPFAWSYRTERLSGYEMQLAVRASYGSRFTAKAAAAFLSGFAAIAIPLILNFVIVSCALPATQPIIEEEITIGIFTDCLFSDLFYQIPLLYVVAYTVLDGAIAGIWSVFVLCLSCVLKNRVSLMVIPYLCLLGWQYLSNMVIGLSGRVFFSLNILNAMQGTYYTAATNPVALLMQLLVLAGASFGFAWWARTQDVM